VIAVDFADTEVSDIGRISTLDAPHRVFDAIVRDSELKDAFQGTRPASGSLKPSRKTPAPSMSFHRARSYLCAWNSTGEGGGLGAKFPRTVVRKSSESALRRKSRSTAAPVKNS